MSSLVPGVIATGIPSAGLGVYAPAGLSLHCSGSVSEDRSPSVVTGPGDRPQAAYSWLVVCLWLLFRSLGCW